MKKLLIIGGALAATALGTHFALWKQHATIVEDSLEHLVTSVNNTLKTKAITLRHDGKETQAAYPLKASVTYKNPVIEFTPEFFAHPEIKAFYDNAEDEFPFVTSVQVNGDYAINSSSMGKSLTTTIIGAASTTGYYLHDNSAGKQEIAYTLTSDAPMQCSMTLAHSPLRYAFGNTAPAGGVASEKFARAFDKVGCATDKATMTEKGKTEPLISWDNYNTTLNLSDSTQKDHRVIDADIAIKALEYFTTQEAMLQEYERAFAPLSDEQRSVFALLRKHPVPALSAKEAGKQDINLKARYDGAVTEAELARDDAEFDVHVEKLEVKNNLYHTNTPFSLRMNKNAMSVTLDGTGSYSPTFETMLHHSVDAIMQIIHSPELNVNPELKAMLLGIKPEQLHALVPKWNELGEIAITADVHLPAAEGEKMTLKNTGFSAKPYSLMIQGDGTLDPLNGETNLRCTSCKPLLHDIVNYVQKLQALSQQMNLALVPDAAKSVQLTPEFSNAIVEFILSLDTKTDKDATIITLNATPEAGITISGSPMMMVMFKGLATFSPYLQP